jgi:ribosomal protein L11 methyltransferase
MYLWRKTVAQRWLVDREAKLQTRARDQLAVIAKPGGKRLQIEIACVSRMRARHLLRDFGGRIVKLPCNWLKRFTHERSLNPLRIGKRLVVCRTRGKREAGSFPYKLMIPLGAAFGTGDHATTAMSLRLLEGITRGWAPGWSLVDLGTGSGILALAASRFGAGSVIAIDADPTAMSTAKANARLNQIDSVDFRVGDVRNWRPSRKIEVVTANLFSELLVEIVPKLRRSGWLILSGVLRIKEKEVLRALRRNGIRIVEVRRRGKWIAVLAKGSAGVSRAKQIHAHVTDVPQRILRR